MRSKESERKKKKRIDAKIRANKCKKVKAWKAE